MTLSRLLIATLVLALPYTACADEKREVVLKNHVFTPAEIKVPADTAFKLMVKNEDATVAEFESKDLNREKIVKPNSSIVVSFGKLKAGTYEFVDEFHEDTAKGKLIVE